MAEPKFGPAGNSESFAAAGFKKSEDAPAWLAQMGLTAFEYQCGRGVRCGEETALASAGISSAFTPPSSTAFR